MRCEASFVWRVACDGITIIASAERDAEDKAEENVEIRSVADVVLRETVGLLATGTIMVFERPADTLVGVQTGKDRRGRDMLPEMGLVVHVQVR